MKKAENKLFFFDFDGTLWFGRYGDRTIKALNTLRENKKAPTLSMLLFSAKGGIRTLGRLLAEHTISSRAP